MTLTADKKRVNGTIKQKTSNKTKSGNANPRVAFGDISNRVQADTEKLGKGGNSNALKKVVSNACAAIPISSVPASGFAIDRSNNALAPNLLIKPTCVPCHTNLTESEIANPIQASVFASNAKAPKRTVSAVYHTTFDPSTPKSKNSDAIAFKEPLLGIETEESTAKPTQIEADALCYQINGNIHNIDKRDADDPFSVTAYVQDMYTYFREKEESDHYGPYYMEEQKITEKMRAILVDWLASVAPKFEMKMETLYLTVGIIDRYLSKKEATKSNLQLIGVSALLIASKYEEIYPVEVNDLVYICDTAYTKNKILEMEEKVLKTLNYQISFPTAQIFLKRYLRAGMADTKIVHLSCFILEETLLTYKLLKYRPSQLAAAAVFIARVTTERKGWSPTLLKYTGYRAEDVIPVAREVIAAHKSIGPCLEEIKKKYSSRRYSRVANENLVSDF